MHRSPRALLAVLVALGVACDGPVRPPDGEPEGETQGATTSPPATSPIGDELRQHLDLRADPCVDFYRFACGGWLARNTLPDDRARHGRGFGELIDRNNEVVREILEESARAGPSADDPSRRLLGTFYATCMDQGAIDRRGVEPLRPWLDRIAAIPDRAGLLRVVGELHTRVVDDEVSPLFSATIEPDPKHPDVYVLSLGQGGLGLPDRDLYLDTGAESKALRDLYRGHVAAMLAFLGAAPAEAERDAAAILAFETELARLSRPRAAMREPESIYHLVGEGGLARLAPKIPWDAYFAALDVGAIGPALNVRVPEFFAGLARALDRQKLATLRAYLRWHLIHATAEHLSAAIVDEDFRLTAALTGQKRLPERWERCTDHANLGGLGEILGPAFVARRFAGESRSVAQALIEAVEQAFSDGLPGLEWMDDRTRAAARDKMRALTNKIGHPIPWRSAIGLDLRAGAHLENIAALRAYQRRRHAGQIGAGVDKSEWELPPAIVNAYYNPPFNEMVFPAGILQPPYFRVDWPMAMNFGGIGMVIGHELTHGFDDEGRKFDQNGVLQEWWAPEASAAFSARAQCIDDAYSAVEVLPGVHLNGRLTLGENIADFGGIKAAHSAYATWVRERGPEPRILPELTNEQVFFVAFAQSWCSLASPEITRLHTTTDPHAPPEQRVNLPLAHLPAFWEAFQCEPGKPMHTSQVCEIW